MKCPRHAVRMGKMGNALEILGRKPARKIPLGRTKRRFEYNNTRSSGKN
jgi:hypothetical protein